MFIARAGHCSYKIRVIRSVTPRMSCMWVSRSFDWLAKCARSPSPVYVGVKKRTALIWHDRDDGRQFLVFGAVARLIESIEAIEADA
jgi:hypothetical protein